MSFLKSSSRRFAARTTRVARNWRFGHFRKFSSVNLDDFRPTDIGISRLSDGNEGITVVTLQRPKANALGRNMLAELREAFQLIELDPVTRVVVIKSALERIFCAGADLKERLEMSDTEVATHVSKHRNAMTELQRLSQPTIAVIDGAALGGGLEFALACDMRVAGCNATLGLPETSLAIIPGNGGTQRLSRLIGAARAKELIFTGERIGAHRAEEYGIVNYHVESPSGYDKAIEIARRIIPKGPIAVKAAKRAIDRGLEVDIDSGLAFERECYAQVIPTEDRIEGLKAFREKRTPVYKANQLAPVRRGHDLVVNPEKGRYIVVFAEEARDEFLAFQKSVGDHTSVLGQEFEVVGDFLDIGGTFMAFTAVLDVPQLEIVRALDGVKYLEPDQPISLDPMENPHGH